VIFHTVRSTLANVVITDHAQRAAAYPSVKNLNLVDLAHDRQVVHLRPSRDHPVVHLRLDHLLVRATDITRESTRRMVDIMDADHRAVVHLHLQVAALLPLHQVVAAPHHPVGVHPLLPLHQVVAAPHHPVGVHPLRHHPRVAAPHHPVAVLHHRRLHLVAHRRLHQVVVHLHRQVVAHRRLHLVAAVLLHPRQVVHLPHLLPAVAHLLHPRQVAAAPLLHLLVALLRHHPAVHQIMDDDVVDTEVDDEDNVVEDFIIAKAGASGKKKLSKAGRQVSK
jgi:hypothetical protein